MRAGRSANWVLFVPSAPSWLTLQKTDHHAFQVQIGPLHRTFQFNKSNSVPSSVLKRPDNELLPALRKLASDLVSGHPSTAFESSLYTPIQGVNSLEHWERVSGFLQRQFEREERVIEEYWVLREGTWRYWRIFAGPNGAEGLLRFELTENGNIVSFGMNPATSPPEVEKRIVID